MILTYSDMFEERQSRLADAVQRVVGPLLGQLSIDVPRAKQTLYPKLVSYLRPLTACG